MAAAVMSAGTSWKNSSRRSMSAVSVRPSRAAFSARASAWPVLAHHSPAVSPGFGTMALSSTRRSTGTCSHTSGAVKPPSDWPTTMSWRRSPIALTTMSVYSASPAELSAAGRSGATTSWPRPRSSGTSRCQYAAAPPAPGMSTYVAIVTSACGRGHSVSSPPRRAPQWLDLAPLRPNLALERDVEYLVHVIHERERDVFAHPGGNLLQVAPVVVRRHDLGQPGPMRRQHLLLQPADRHDPAAQRDLTGHAQGMVDRTPGECRDDSRGHRDARARSVLGHRARRHVDVHVPINERIVVAEAQRSAARPGIRQRSLGRLFHHLAELPGEQQIALAGHHARLDEQDLAPRRRICQTGGDADLVSAGDDLLLKARRSELFGHGAMGHRHRRRVAHHDRSGRFARNGRDLALQVAHAGFAGVVANDPPQRGVGETHLANVEAVLYQLAGHQVAFGDLELVVLGVTGQVDDFE